LEDDTHKTILVHGAFGGRIDQTLASLHILHKFYLAASVEQTLVVLHDDYSRMVYVKPKVAYSIDVDPNFEETRGVGLVPIPVGPEGSDNWIETTGLQWNLGD